MRKNQTHTGLWRRTAFLTCLATASISATAAGTGAANLAPDTEDAKAALIAFAQCDSSFFKLLGKTPLLLGPGVEVAMNGVAAAPKVADPLAEKGRDQTFAKPIDVAGMRLAGWHNEVSYDATAGAFIWWGFDVEGSTDAAATAINRLLQPAQRVLKIQGSDWARSENRRIGDPLDEWRRGGENGTVTARGTVERALTIETNERTGRTKLYCTLQGSVTPPLLDRERPDLPASLHP
jgi:hypothetical protein